MASSEVKITFDMESVARWTESIEKLADAVRQARPMAVEPWTIETNSGAMIAYLDDRNKEHFVLPDDIVPDDWRKLYVEKRA